MMDGIKIGYGAIRKNGGDSESDAVPSVSMYVLTFGKISDRKIEHKEYSENHDEKIENMDSKNIRKHRYHRIFLLVPRLYASVYPVTPVKNESESVSDGICAEVRIFSHIVSRSTCHMKCAEKVRYTTSC